MSKTNPESVVQTSILAYMQQRGYTFWRTNNTPVYDARIGGHRAMPEFSIKGVADISMIHNGRAVFIEVKNDETYWSKKTYQSKDQKAFQKTVEDAGGLYVVVRSIDDFMDFENEHLK